MAQVNVSINNRQYRMACEDGQEDHLRQLAKDLDDRINSLRGQFGEIGDSRLVVMAALMIADDVVETGKKARRLEQEIAALQDARGASAVREPDASGGFCVVLRRLRVHDSSVGPQWMAGS